MPLPVTTIERDIPLIKFKFARILRTDLGMTPGKMLPKLVTPISALFSDARN